VYNFSGILGCIDNKMHFIARYKEGSASNIQRYVDANAHHVDAKIEGAPLAKIRYCNEVPHQDLKLNYVEFINFKDVQDFKYVTDLDVNERNALDVILAGRGRWQIEEAFRAQKQNLDLEHIFSYDWDIAINVYNLQQISHALEQLLVYHYEDLANKVAHSILILNFLEGFRTITYSQNVTNSKHTDSTDHQIVVA
jgi:hypothetical protein